MATATNVLADRYEVRKKLGEGGMGVVYLAHDRNLKTDVVVKMPLPSAMADPGFVARFTEEISALVKLRHPHVVQIIDVGTHGKRPFAVMAFLGGGSLQDRGMPSPPSALAAWLPSIASALDFVHGRRMLHRDVKPANILFDQNGFAFLSDFGVAKVLAEGPAEAARQPLTGAGLVIGTAEYMAPELIRARKDVDGRADQYALAATVYEVLCGRPPFVANEAQAVMVMQVTDDVPPLVGVAPALQEAVLRGLAKEPHDRYATCAEFAEAVVAAAGGSPSAAHRLSGAARRPSSRAETPAAGQVAKTRIEAPPADKIASGAGKWKMAPEPADPPRGNGGLIVAAAVIAVMVLGAGTFVTYLLNKGGTKPDPVAKEKEKEGGTKAETAEAGFTLTPPGEVRVAAGDTARKASVKIDRKGYLGVVRVTLPGLPEGVTLRAVEMPPGVSEMPLVIETTENAKPFDSTVRLVGKGTDIERTAEFRLVVEGKPRLALSATPRSATLPLGQTTKVQVTITKENCRDKVVRLSPSAASRGAFRDIFEKPPPEELPAGVETFTLEFRPKRKPTGPLTLKLEAQLDGDASVTATLTLECRVVD